MFGPVKDKLSGDWRIRKNDELEILFYKPHIMETIWTKDNNGLGMLCKNKIHSYAY